MTTLLNGFNAEKTDEETEVIKDLVLAGHADAAKRIDDLIDMYDRDKNTQKINIDSMRCCAAYIKHVYRHRTGENVADLAGLKKFKTTIVLDWDGILATELSFPDMHTLQKGVTRSGILGIEFLPDGTLEYQGFDREWGSDAEVEYEGIATLETIIDEIYDFVKKI